MKNKFVLIFILLLLVCGCGNVDNNKNGNNELTAILAKNNYLVVDVRTNEEYAEGHVVGSINVPYDEIDSDTLIDETRTLLVYCKSGARSSKAYDKFKELGFDVYDLGAYDNIMMEKE